VINPGGFPRTFLASSTDDAGALGAVAEDLAINVNDGRAFGTNGPFVRVTVEAASTGETGGHALGEPTLIGTTNGSATVTVDIQSPLWAEFDTVEYYVNHVPTIDDVDGDVTTPPLYRVTPDYVQTAGTDFTVTTVDNFPSIAGAEHLEATTSLALTGLTDDTWVVVVIRGTDGVSRPLWPVVPLDLDQAANPTLADLTDGNLDEEGVVALSFTNPLFIDVDGNDSYDRRDVDSDRDGCFNSRELLLDEKLGGRRGPSNPWDYYDVVGPTGPKDRYVDLANDIAAISRKYQQRDSYTTTLSGQHAAGIVKLNVVSVGDLNPSQGGVYLGDVIVIDPGGPNEELLQVFGATNPIAGTSITVDANLTPGNQGVPTAKKHAGGETVRAYIASYDRGGRIPGGEPWDLLPANGTMDLPNDIVGVAYQFQHDCR
jgi:hypothetical protein